MDTIQRCLSAIWREASVQGEIQKTAARIGEILRRHTAFDELQLLRVDAKEPGLFSVAAYGAKEAQLARAAKLDRAALSKLMSWHRKGAPLFPDGDTRGLFSLLLGPDREAPDVVAALPLKTKRELPGVALCLSSGARRVSKEERALLALLQEPLTAALDNDRAYHELRAFQEAAEADRQSLLIRLGRKELPDSIVGAESGLTHVMERIELVSRSDVPVLLLGETGTGKEILARAIHTRSSRAGGPFIRVNCGAIPPELIDSQLFGHEKGSFTGANESRKGWFERADQGTLLLDEIGELPLDAQVRFLRVLQDGYIERVGGHEPIRVSVRVIAATHRDLAQMVRERSFREDLWYRIAVFPILVPPLRDRKEDLPALARHFIQRAAQRFGLPTVEPTEEHLELLRQYHWPGNIRELAAVLDRAVILGGGTTLEVFAAFGFSEGAARLTADPAVHVEHHSGGAGPVLSLNQAITKHIETALKHTHGRIEGPQGAAALLDINPHTLRAKMRKLRIEAQRYRTSR